MFGSWRIAKIFGIDLSIHWTFWLLPVFIILTYDGNSLLPLWMHLILIGCLFACVVLHEFGHALTAREFGIRTRSITLSPLGGIAQLDRMSHKPWEEFWIAIAGPLVNVAIAILLSMLVLPMFLVNPGLLDTLIGRFLSVLLGMNVMLVVFNLLPAFPMDGGRILRAILASSLGLLQGTRVAVAIGAVLAILMGIAGFYIGQNGLMLTLIAVFVFFAGQQELLALEMEERRHNEAMRMTICLWDSARGDWVRRDISVPRGR